MNKRIVLLCSLLLAAVSSTSAQGMLEKDYEISRKAKKGYLGNVEKNEDGTFDMIYILPSSARKIKTEIYHFDKEANLLGTDKDEMEIEKARKKWSWFNYKGDIFITNTLSASANMMSQLVFRKKAVTAHYDWWTGRYNRDVKMLDKIKPTDEEGRKYSFLGGAYEVERDSSVLVMAVNSNKGFKNVYKEYDLLKCDNNVNVKVMKKLNFPYAVRCIFSEPLQDDLSGNIENDDMPRDWIVIFAPTSLVSKGDRADESGMFHYLRISPEGNVKEQYEFKSPTTGFRIISAFEKDGGILLYGMGAGKDSKYFDQIFKGGLVATTSADESEQAASNTDAGGAFGGYKKMAATFSGKDDVGITQEKIDETLDEMKYSSFVFVKLKAGKMAFGNLTDIGELNDKAVAAADMKKPLKFDGNKFHVNNLQILSDNSIALSVQDFKKINKNSGGGSKFLNTLAGSGGGGGSRHYSAKIFKGMYLMHFNENGQLQHNYTVNVEQKKKGFFNNSPMTADMFPATSYLYESADKSKVSWVMHIVKAIDKDVSTYGTFNTYTVTSYNPLYSIEYGNIDLKAGTASEFKTLGDDEKRKFYLYDNYNTLNHNDFVYFFSETTRGDKMLISRMELK